MSKEKTQVEYMIEEQNCFRRMREFNGPIQQIADRIPMIRHIIELYARGQIVTKEEALSQMVVQLANNWRESYDRYVDLVQRASPGTFIIPPPS